MSKVKQLSTVVVRALIVDHLRRAGNAGATRAEMLGALNQSLKRNGESVSQHYGQALDFIDPEIPVDYIGGRFYHRNFT